MPNRILNLRVILMSGAMAALPGVALAQSAAPASTAEAAAADTARLTDIVVTAQRRSERLQDVPIAVTALSGDSLAARGVQSTTDLTQTTPGLNFGNFSGSAIVFLRGVGNANPNVGNDPSVAIYIDGVYQPAPKALQFGLANIERIEVLKGPQGTLFGRNATGGAIQIVTKTPSDRFVADLSAAFESYKTFEGKAYVGGPISDKLTADVSLYYRNQTDGIGKNFTTGKDVMEGWEYSGRTKWVFRPDEDTDLTFTASRAKIRSTLAANYQLLAGAYALDAIGSGRPYTRMGDAFDNNSNGDPVLKVKQSGLSFRADHDFGGARFAAITGYTNTRSYYHYDIDQTPIPLLNADLPEREKSFSQEVQLLSSKDSKLQWIIGAFYYNATYAFPLRLTGFGLTPATFDQRDTHGRTRSYSVFAQATYPIAEATNITVGGRYSWDKLSYRGKETTDFGTVTAPNDRSSSKEPTWRLSIDHKFTPDVMVYGSYNRGYKSGAFNLINVPSEAATKPEKLDAYEIGLKSTLLDRRVRFNAAGFYYKYTNLQVLVNQGIVATNRNAAKARIYGLDAELEARASEQLSLNFGVSVLNAKFTDFPGAVIYAPNPITIGGNSQLPQPQNAKGNRIPRTPKYTLNAGLSYTIPTASGDFALSVTNFYSDGFYWHVDNRIKQKAYDITNAEISFTLPDKHWKFRVYSRNIFNKTYLTDVQESQFADFGVAGSPRYIGGAVEFKY